MKVNPISVNTKTTSLATKNQKTNPSFKGSYGSGIREAATIAGEAAKSGGLSGLGVLGLVSALVIFCVESAKMADEMYRDMSNRDKEDFLDYYFKSQTTYG